MTFRRRAVRPPDSELTSNANHLLPSCAGPGYLRSSRDFMSTSSEASSSRSTALLPTKLTLSQRAPPSNPSTSSTSTSAASTLSHKFGRLLGTVLSSPSSSSEPSSERALRRGWVDLVSDAGPSNSRTANPFVVPSSEDSPQEGATRATEAFFRRRSSTAAVVDQQTTSDDHCRPPSSSNSASSSASSSVSVPSPGTMAISEPSPLRPTWLRGRSRSLANPPPSSSSAASSIAASPSKWGWAGSLGRRAKEPEVVPPPEIRATQESRSGCDDAQRVDMDVDEGFFDGHVSKQFDLLAALPLELALYVLLFLPASSVASASQVSKSWNVLAADNSIWRSIFHSKPAWRLRSTFDLEATTSSLRSPTLTPSLQQSLSSSSDARSWKNIVARRTWLERRWGNPKASRQTVYKGHDDSVYCLQFDALKLVTGSRDKNLKVWSLKTGECIQTVKAHDASVLCLMYEEETGFMVTGGSDSQVVAWDLGGSRLEDIDLVKMKVLTPHAQGVLDVALSAEYIVSCSKDMTLHVTSRSTLQHLHTLSGHSGPVNALGLFSHRVASASGDGKIRLWDLRTGECDSILEGHERGLACVEMKGDWVVSGSNDRTIKVWNASTGVCLRTLKGHTELVRTLAFDPDTRRIVSGGYDKQILIWDLQTGEIVQKLRSSHTSLVFDIKFDAGRIASASHDQSVVVHDFGDEETGRMFA